MSKTIYTYAPVVHVYVGTAQADPDPLVKGNWLYPANSTDIAPPPAADRMAAVFDPSTQSWNLAQDWRQVPLYETATGSPYNPFGNSQGEIWVPIGALPDWLTDQPRPSADYVWVSGSWALDVDRETARLTSEAQLQVTKLMAAAEQATVGLSDAYLAGQLTDDEKTRFEAWAAYKRLLYLVPSQAGYPRTIEWPTPPSA